MAASVVSAGSQTAVITTEHTLLDTSTAGTYELVVELTNLAAGDILELRVYDKVNAGSYALHEIASYGPIPPARKVKRAFALLAPRGMKFTLKQVAGTGRAFPWEVRAP